MITLDVLMPKMDGWAVLKELKSDPELADIPVIMATITDERNLGIALGASEYLTKPIDRDRLAAILARYTRRRADACWSWRTMTPRATSSAARSRPKAGGRRGRERPRGARPLAECEPALVLLDLMMPEMDGFEFLGDLA